MNRASYYAWRTGQAAREARAAEDAQLTEEIREIHRVSTRANGVRRVIADLGMRRKAATRGPVNRKKVARLMREAGTVESRRSLRRYAKTRHPIPGDRPGEHTSESKATYT